MPPREIGSREVARILQMNRSWVNELALKGRMPGLLRKDPGGPANLGRYVFDADVIERIARDRIAAIETALREALPPQLPSEDDAPPAVNEQMRAAS